MQRDPAALEAILARLYVDAEARARFVAEPAEELQRAELGDQERAWLAAIDRAGLELAARSFASKRAGKLRRPRSLFDRLRRAVARLFRPLGTKSSLSSR